MNNLQKNTITGQHLLVDLDKLDISLILNNVEEWFRAIELACEKLKADILLKNHHIFRPPRALGFTAFVLLDSSHISIHTYANRGKAAIDMFICNDKDLYEAFSIIKKEIGFADENIANIQLVQRFIE